jgi:copper chaperone CopZ
VRVAIRKLPGIESVDVSLERAAVDIRLRAGNTVSLSKLRQIIKDNGFTAREATVTVVGGLIERGGKPALNVTGPNVVMLIAPDPKQTAVYEQVQAQLRARRAQAIELRGVVESRRDEPDQIVVAAVGTSAK